MKRLNLRARQRSRMCIYCGGNGTTRDHIPPKSFFEEPLPRNLITVPACEGCNSGFSKDEEYFLAFVTGVSDTPIANRKVDDGGQVDRMLWRKPNLEQLLLQSFNADGSVTPDQARLDRIFIKCARGLYYNRYGKIAGTDFRVLYSGYGSAVPTNLLLAFHTSRFRPKRWNRFAAETFEYIFTRSEGSGLLLLGMLFYNSVLAVVECPAPGAFYSGWRTRRKQFSLFDEN